MCTHILKALYNRAFVIITASAVDDECHYSKHYHIVQCLAFQRLTIPSNKRVPHNFRKICTAGVLEQYRVLLLWFNGEINYGITSFSLYDPSIRADAA